MSMGIVVGPVGTSKTEAMREYVQANGGAKRAETWRHHISQASESLGCAAFILKALLDQPHHEIPSSIRAEMAADELLNAADSIAIAIGRDMAARIHQPGGGQ